MFKTWSCISALLACTLAQSLSFAQGLSTRNIFVTPVDLASSSASLYTTEPLSFAGTIPTPAGTTQIIAGPTGKYYAIGRTPGEGVGVLTGIFPNLQLAKRLALPGIPTAAALSPDGRRLVVIYPGGFQLIDTNTDTAITSAAVIVGSNPSAVAISTDSRKAFILSADLQKVVAIATENGASAGELAIVGQGTSLTVSPNSLVYVTVQNAIYEIDPRTLQLIFTYTLNGNPSTVAFTPDGRVAISANNSLVTGKSAFYLDTVRKTATDIPPVGAIFTKILVADANTAYAYSNQTNRIYLLVLTSPSAPSLFAPPNVSFENTRDIVLSNESPSARTLFVLTTGGLYRYDRSQTTTLGPVAAPVGFLSYAGPAAIGAPASLLQVNSTQTVAPGAASLPLIVRAVDISGVPLANVTVQFTSDATVSLSATSAATDLQGYAQTVATVASSAATGVATVTASASGQSVPFTINIAAGGGGGGGGGGGTTPGGLQIVSGQGQVTGVGFPTQEPLTVRVVDAAGNPIPGVPITWAVAQGTGNLGNVLNATNDKGIATAAYVEFLVPFGVPYVQATISASSGAETVNFIVTTVPRLPNGSPGEATYTLRAPVSRSIDAKAGETVKDAIQVVVGSLLGPAIPNVGLRIANDDITGPTASCRGGVPLSDETGLVTCDLIAAGTVGETTIRAIVGEKVQYSLFLKVTAGSPSVVRITGGNNQAGNAGQLLPQTLVVEVTDAGGNLLPNVDVAWDVLPAGNATLSQTQVKTDINGRATSRVTLGQTPGALQVRARAGTGSASFSLTANLNATSMVINGGVPQSAVIGQQFAQPISVRVTDAQSRPVPGASVAFQVASGSATVTPTATTDANGIASATVTAGPTPGPVVINAVLAGLSQAINLTVRTPGPDFSASSFLNGADFQPGISPGAIAVIYAAGIAPSLNGTVTPPNPVGPLPTTLSGVEVLFNGVNAPIFSVSNINGKESVNVQVPFETAPGTASVTIRTAGGGSTTVASVPIQAAKPGIFGYLDANGKLYGVAMRPDGSYITSTNPARLGDIIRVFATGLGQTSPAAATNSPGVRDQNVVANVISGINNEGVRTVSARMLEGSIGVYLVEMEIPQTTTTGDSRPLALAVPGPDGAPVFGGSAIPIQ